MSAAPLLDVADLTTEYWSGGQRIVAVDKVSFMVREGEILGLVGESGCGKSATCRSILRLFANARARITSGRVDWRGRDLLGLREDEMAAVRGAEIAMIFQDPMSALNPTMRIGRQIAEGLRAHQRLGAREGRHGAIDLLAKVGVPNAAARVDEYPHQFSGGMRQRVAIALAIACRPKLLLADEPTTALDVTIQDQILKLLLQLRGDLGMSIIIVTHDLGVVAQTCDRVAVMYAGKIVETADTVSLFAQPRHPYTRALLRSVPGARGWSGRLRPIEGQPPDLTNPPPGCRFHPRCSWAVEACRETVPTLMLAGEGHRTACIRHRDLT